MKLAKEVVGWIVFIPLFVFAVVYVNIARALFGKDVDVPLK